MSTYQTTQLESPLAPEWLAVPDDGNHLNPTVWPQGTSRTEGGELALSGLRVSELADRFGTPAYILSEDHFRSRARAFRDAFTAAFEPLCGGVDVYYAGKSFLCVEVAKWVKEEGLRLDTCSGGELALAARAGIDGSELGLHGNNKSDAEIDRALDMGVGRIVVDSLHELERVGDIARMKRLRAPILLRLTPGVHAETHDYIATAHEDQKFGLSMAQVHGEPSPADKAVSVALGHPSLELLGVHCHIGSQIFSPDGFALAAEKLLTFIAAVRDAHGVSLEELDLGGGYGIAYTDLDDPKEPTELATAMADVVGTTCERLGIGVPRISIEPGRAIVGSSTFTLYAVGTLKTIHVQQGGDVAERRYVSVDGGMSDNPRPVLYGATYTATLASRRSGAPPVLSRVVGKHCESGDIVVKDAYLPADLATGDLLAVPGTGAYCWVLGSNYNYTPRPPVVAVSQGKARLILRGETEEDLFQRDVSW
ncbi:diaminopimelate decarboxylase [Paenarthrobacter ureafaciens]|uniref:diaminopimelate decarboxylase n=1 Tax=Paenarthrobacter ureafaciens TaxID=37931 RepID=UPI001408C8C4|nr:diaminopimelate decarboxylase [Paenarthrobacter ureafaciens]MCX8453673.1 diaminopimelate decarboxylase [Paenarthrobacter ureafaciens]MCY0973332.1 diaminopimelate decarboxylase [Paenarthrobacter ureafaciens]